MAAMTPGRVALLSFATDSAVTGTAAVTLAAATASASGTHGVTGTAAPTCGAATSSASGTHGVTGTAAPTCGAATSDATGTHGVTGTIAVTCGAATSTASGSVTVTGTIAVTLGAATSTASGSGGDTSDTYARVYAVTELATVAAKEDRMHPVSVAYRSLDEDPGIAFEWRDRDNAILDMSTATFSMLISPIGGGTTTTKTSGITGAATSPNVVVTWSAGELATLGAGQYSWLLTATVGGRQRTINAANPGKLLVVS